MVSRSIIPEDEISVALDNLIIRNFSCDTPAWLDTFEEMANNKCHFSITDASLAELVNQFERGSVTEEEWAQIISHTSRFISKRLPVLPGKKQLFQMIGVHVCDAGNDFDPFFEAVYSQALWSYCSELRNSNDLQEKKFKFSYRGEEYGDDFCSGEIEEELMRERVCWVDAINQFSSNDKVSGNTVEILDAIKVGIDFWSSSTPPLFIRLNLVFQYLLHVIEDKSRSKQPYNPKAKSKKNDGIDFLLSFALAIPALLCTGDKKLIARVGRLSSYQKKWVLKPEELAEAWVSGTFLRPCWPDENDRNP